MSANAAASKPLIGFPSDTYETHGFLFHSLGDKYVRAVAEVSAAMPVMIPSAIDLIDIDGLLDRLDGMVMTGAISNVHPPEYGEKPTGDHEPYDHRRDATTLTMIRAVLARGMPLFCICRGFQELNVALGGSLETELQRGAGRLDHRAAKHDDPNVRYAPAHDIAITSGGFLERVLGKSSMRVNSIHRQGIKTLAAGLVVEAVAPDGVIEAVSVEGAESFAFGTQWHPEFRAAENPDSVRLFQAFGAAARDFAQTRAVAPPPARRRIA